jgi:hypothetical protein
VDVGAAAARESRYEVIVRSDYLAMLRGLTLTSCASGTDRCTEQLYDGSVIGAENQLSVEYTEAGSYDVEVTLQHPVYGQLTCALQPVPVP